MLDSAAYRSADAFLRLTAREEQVLEMTARGLTNRQIAEGLAVTIHAVKFHLATIYRKLEVSNRTEATFLYLRRNNAADSPSEDSST
jgi:DNA-binding CsgD family transcriptional regulator